MGSEPICWPELGFVFIDFFMVDDLLIRFAGGILEFVAMNEVGMEWSLVNNSC